jgi:hypothetical protein
LSQACTEDDSKHAALLARDAESDLETGAVINEIWNVMGRPKQSIDYDLIVNGGKSVWTDGDPAKQPALMALLAENIRGSDHPKLAGKKEDWAKRIEAKAAARAEAATAALASHARVTFLTIHEIIPDVPPSTSRAPATTAAPAAPAAS